MSENTSSSSSGISAFGLLGVLFVALKLFGVTEVAAWSWWWVLAPFWIGVAIVLVIVLGALLIAGVLSLFDK